MRGEVSQLADRCCSSSHENENVPELSHVSFSSWKMFQSFFMPFQLWPCRLADYYIHSAFSSWKMFLSFFMSLSAHGKCSMG